MRSARVAAVSCCVHLVRGGLRLVGAKKGRLPRVIQNGGFYRPVEIYIDQRGSAIRGRRVAYWLRELGRARAEKKDVGQ